MRRAGGATGAGRSLTLSPCDPPLSSGTASASGVAGPAARSPMRKANHCATSGVYPGERVPAPTGTGRPASCSSLARSMHLFRTRTPHGSRLGIKHVKFMRSRPWRSRGPWFGNRAGARRRGYRDDEVLSVAYGVFPDGDDVVRSAASEAIVAEDMVLADAAGRSLPESMLAARVDVSGLLAIASPEAGAMLEPGEGAIIAVNWPTRAGQNGDDSSVSRHSA